MHENVIDETTDGRFRVIVEQDLDPMSPGDWDDPGMDVYDVDYRHGWSADHWAGPDTGDLTRGLRDALDRWGSDHDLVERYLRMFHGLVKLDTYDRRGGGRILAIVTEDHLSEWGGNAELVRESDLLASWRMYDEGDVWCYAVEESVTWMALDADGNPDPEREYGPRETWETVDSLCGMYGYDYAVEEAREALASV